MSQIFENQLNLALETPEAEREQTQDLNVGFSTEENTWELIVKYHDTLERLRTGGIGVEYLIAGYAILTVSESRVEELTSYPEIEYVEKPKRYYYSRVRPTDVSCIPQVMFREPFLTGEGVLIAVLDSGIAYRREVFRNADGSSRILELWDQTLQPDSRTEEQQDEDDSDNIADTVRAIREPPRGFAQGVLFDRDIINAALRLDAYEGNLLVPSTDVSGHGTAVAGIAAASASDGYSGVANRSDLLIVKLGTPNEGGFPRTTEIMRGVTYAVNKALELGVPLVVNLSFGNTYGAHDGSSLLERFLDNASEIGRTVICVGSGNEASTNGHFEGVISERRMAELAVGSYERSLSVQLWKDYADDFLLQMRSPGGEEATLSPAVEAGKYTLSLEGTKILVYFGEPTPYSAAQEIYLEFLPQEAGNTGTVSTGSGNAGFLTEGIWRFTLVPINIVNGRYSFYLPGAATRNERTGFFDASPEATFTIPSTAGKVLTVGAYDSYFESYAPFSGRGYGDLSDREAVTQIGLTKPDIAAPGVNIMAPDVYGGWISVSGTSFATPIVSGVCALMMQWGIIEKRDEFLYGEKLKAYLRRGARPIRGERAYPNSKVGYGGICIFDSLL